MQRLDQRVNARSIEVKVSGGLEGLTPLADFRPPAVQPVPSDASIPIEALGG